MLCFDNWPRRILDRGLGSGVGAGARSLAKFRFRQYPSSLTGGDLMTVHQAKCCAGCWQQGARSRTSRAARRGHTSSRASRRRSSFMRLDRLPICSFFFLGFRDPSLR
jgi:hypothetical protein